MPKQIAPKQISTTSNPGQSGRTWRHMTFYAHVIDHVRQQPRPVSVER